MEKKAKDIETIIDTGTPVFVIYVSDNCGSCTLLKKELPRAESLAASLGIGLETLKVNDPDNLDFLKANPFNELPHCKIFSKKTCRGGGSVNIDGVVGMLNVVAQAEKQENA